MTLHGSRRYKRLHKEINNLHPALPIVPTPAMISKAVAQAHGVEKRLKYPLQRFDRFGRLTNGASVAGCVGDAAFFRVGRQARQFLL